MKNFIYNTLMIFAITIIVFSIFSALELDFWKYRMYRVGSGSMEPYLKVGDIIIIKETTNYEVGDVVTFKQGEEYVTHRIVLKNGEIVTTKGDANNTNDSSIKTKEIVGKLIYKIPAIGSINKLLSRPLSWIIIFFAGLFITILTSYERKKGKHAL